MKTVFLCGLILTVLAISNADEQQEGVVQLSKGNNLFGDKLYADFSKKAGNFVFSPLSAYRVLSMLYFGTQGSTQKALAQSLHFVPQESVNVVPDHKIVSEGTTWVSNIEKNLEGVRIDIADKIYTQLGYKLKDNFNNSLHNYFNSEIGEVNFANIPTAVDEINHWAAEKVKGIGKVVSSDQIGADTRLVLLNAIYFKGAWQTPFKKERTRTEPFYLTDKESVDVQMMHMHEDNIKFARSDALKAKLIQLPFKNPNVSMVVILPNEKNGLTEVEKKLQQVNLDEILASGEEVEVELALPKFKITSKLQLEEPLTNIGLGEIFDGTKANFSNMLEEDIPLQVGSVLQKAVIEVNEEGATAKVITSAGIQLLSATFPEYFIADHPFIVLIRAFDETPLTLFQARVARPESGDNWIAPAGTPVTEAPNHNIYLNLD